jgi:hypothetical protein
MKLRRGLNAVAQYLPTAHTQVDAKQTNQQEP